MTKHLKIFTSDNERQIFESSDNYLEPYVSIVTLGGGKIYTYYNAPKPILAILTIDNGSKVTLYGKGDFQLTDALSKNNVKNIDSSSITNIELTNNVTRILYNGFNGCSKIKNIIIPSTVTILQKSLFGGCESLTSLTLSDSLKNVDRYVNNYYDTNLHELKIIGKKFASRGLYYEFLKTIHTLYVDASLVERYKTWRDALSCTFEVKPLT